MNLEREWIKLKNDLVNIIELRIKRCVNPYVEKLELHGYADSSRTVSEACTYLRGVGVSGQKSINILCGKSNGTTLSMVSSSKLELYAALLLSMILNNVLETQNIELENIFVLDGLNSSYTVDTAKVL